MNTWNMPAIYYEIIRIGFFIGLISYIYKSILLPCFVYGSIFLVLLSMFCEFALKKYREYREEKRRERQRGEHTVTIRKEYRKMGVEYRNPDFRASVFDFEKHVKEMKERYAGKLYIDFFGLGLFLSTMEYKNSREILRLALLLIIFFKVIEYFIRTTKDNPLYIQNKRLKGG